jgi:tetratricopeptide (TPR) repeat protein
MNDKIPVAGGLKDFDLPQIFFYLNREKKTGILSLESGGVKKEIYLDRGGVVFASSNQEEDRLGEHLIKGNKLTVKQRDESLERSRQTHSHYGKVLLDLGYLLPKHLYLELKNQISDIICSLFIWEKGSFSFEEKSLPHEIIGLSMNLDHLVKEGLKRRERWRMEDKEAFADEINGIFEQIKSLSYYEILGIGMDVSSSDIKSSYMNMVQRYHPDKHMYLSEPELGRKLTIIFSYINKAYQTLSKKSEKARYDAFILGVMSKGGNVKGEAAKVKQQFHIAIAEFNKGNFWQAADILKWAVKKDPENDAYWAHFSLALYKIPRKQKEAEEAILRAIQLKPHKAEYYVHLGMIYHKADSLLRAAKQFRKALEWDPSNERALRELKKLDFDK